MQGKCQEQSLDLNRGQQAKQNEDDKCFENESISSGSLILKKNDNKCPMMWIASVGRLFGDFQHV